MADFEVSYTIESEQQFWDELDEIVSKDCNTYGLIDNTLRAWLHLVAHCRDDLLGCEDDVLSCSNALLHSSIFTTNENYVRTQIIYSLLQEEEAPPLHIIASFLLLDGRAHEDTFRTMITEGCFPKLLDLIKGRREEDPRLHRVLLELMYEMSRIERLRNDDLVLVDDSFVVYLFQLIEAGSDDADDPYHYLVIRVLLVLNEQYMVASTAAVAEPTAPSAPLTNRVIKVLSTHGPHFRTFGENLILLLNRETEKSLQLLILKLLYLLANTEATYEYFYTNDLRVLLDVIIRNLLDLPDEETSLRHLYLRVLAPLLSHTQLNQPPHYKREEILKMLGILRGLDNFHFAPTDETTLRLVDRVSNVKWLGDEARFAEGEVARKFLGISLGDSHTVSSVSVVDVAGLMEKPGVQTPSRKAEVETENKAPAQETGESKDAAKPPRPKKTLPEVPKHRHGVPMTQGATLHINGTGHMQKRLPPKTPPPRRWGKLKATPPSTEACTPADALQAVPGQSSIS